MIWYAYLKMTLLDMWNQSFQRASRSRRLWNGIVLVGRMAWRLLIGLTIALVAALLVRKAYGQAGIEVIIAALFVRAGLLFSVSGLPLQLGRLQEDVALPLLLTYPLSSRVVTVVRAFSAEVLGMIVDSFIRQRLFYFLVYAAVFHLQLTMILRGTMVLAFLFGIGLQFRIVLVDILARQRFGRRLAHLIDAGSMFLLIFVQIVFYASVLVNSRVSELSAAVHRFIPHVLSWSNPFAWPALVIWGTGWAKNILFATAVVCLVFVALTHIFRIYWRHMAQDSGPAPAVLTLSTQQGRRPGRNTNSVIWMDRPLTRRILHLPRFLSLMCLWAYFISQELDVQFLWILGYPVLTIMLLVVQWVIHQPVWSTPLTTTVAMMGHHLNGLMIADILAVFWLFIGQRLLRHYLAAEALGRHFYYFRTFPWRMAEVLLIRAGSLGLLLLPAQLIFAVISSGWVSSTFGGDLVWVASNTLFVFSYAVWLLAGSAWMPVFSPTTNDARQRGRTPLSPSSTVMISITMGFGAAGGAILFLMHWPPSAILITLLLIGIGLAGVAGRRLERLI